MFSFDLRLYFIGSKLNFLTFLGRVVVKEAVIATVREEILVSVEIRELVYVQTLGSTFCHCSRVASRLA
jgi:hypothetical protein